MDYNCCNPTRSFNNNYLNTNKNEFDFSLYYIMIGGRNDASTFPTYNIYQITTEKEVTMKIIPVRQVTARRVQCIQQIA